MKKTAFTRAANDSGQILVLTAVALVTLMALSAFAIDVGYVIHAQHQLQSSADAAALAGAQDLPATTASTTATTYSSVNGKKNKYVNLSNVTMVSGYPMLKCLTSIGLPCDAPANANAIVVKQTATVSMMFAKVIGIRTMTVTATATAAMRGGIPNPLDIMVVLDTTASMSDSCSSAVSGVTKPTRLDCALAGVRALLTSMWPCSNTLTNCGTATGGNVTGAVDKVGLMIFPGLKATAAVSREYDCAENIVAPDKKNPDIVDYDQLPNYAIVPLSSDYRTSTTAGLNGGSSNLVKAVDWSHGNNCNSGTYGVEAVGGVGTSFAGAITAAQLALTTSGRAAAQNVMIFLSDGDATTTTGGTNPCHGAITAADAAALAGTWIYSVAYGAATSGGCEKDKTAITPNQTMQQIASSSSKFLNQPTAGDLTTIFQRIAYDLTTTRLLDNATQ